MSARQMISWWTPVGWEWKPEPEAYRKYEMHDGIPRLSDFGYDEHFGSLDDDFHYLKTYLYNGAEEPVHLKVSLFFISEYTEFCVEEKWIVPFIVDKGIPLLQQMRVLGAPLTSKALTAFVRHGHGTETISSDGEDNHEKMKVQRENARQERLQRERDKARGGGAA